MPIKVNLTKLADQPVSLRGELEVSEFASDFHDKLVRFAGPLRHDLEATLMESGILLRGRIEVPLECACSRCLKVFPVQLKFDDFAALAPLTGEDAVARDGDFADLTPLVREDTFLALPTKPLCKPECRGLAQKASARDSRLEAAGKNDPSASPWVALDKLKL